MAADHPKSDPDDTLPEDDAARLYLAILTAGGRIPLENPALPGTDLAPERQQALLEQLVAVGLVLPNRIDGCYVAVSPRAVAERLGADMRAQATRLLLDADRLPAALDPLARAYDAVPRPADRARQAVYVDGQESIRLRIAQLVSDCRLELLSAQPGLRPPGVLELAHTQDQLMLRRGGTMRTLYQPVALTEDSAVRHATAMAEQGAQLRVLDEPFLRMIVIDRRIAVIPAADDHSRAAFVEDPAAIAYLVAGFERDWARADQVHWHSLDGRTLTRTVTHRVGRMLAQGLTQRAVATRLGLSERTVAGHISRLRELHNAQTLFQLGWLMRGGGRG
ncbi:LuxR C-terminal-related transcriptional regulator [Kitasatospora cheerisanensis]|uniref:Putative LuxR family transcriptional regulator n=1 Tax=Kitasatospora cheerisanensis KCTC 2395 TaxID=1348663 RepID=A0A066Z153_9ACTN|nr:LuxR C-terminal-related transcriptional regulator [Kitasatospora cheerisanensis]KDN84071.1 putative LuxR family transcriptional regulator [Kitasatospora cheerisanensis KCTC 2395]